MSVSVFCATKLLSNEMSPPGGGKILHQKSVHVELAKMAVYVSSSFSDE